MLICALASRYAIKSHLTSFTVYPMIDVSFAFFCLFAVYNKVNVMYRVSLKPVLGSCQLQLLVCRIILLENVIHISFSV